MPKKNNKNQIIKKKVRHVCCHQRDRRWDDPHRTGACTPRLPETLLFLAFLICSLNLFDSCLRIAKLRSPRETPFPPTKMESTQAPIQPAASRTEDKTHFGVADPKDPRILAPKHGILPKADLSPDSTGTYTSQLNAARSDPLTPGTAC